MEDNTFSEAARDRQITKQTTPPELGFTVCLKNKKNNNKNCYCSLAIRKLALADNDTYAYLSNTRSIAVISLTLFRSVRDCHHCIRGVTGQNDQQYRFLNKHYIEGYRPYFALKWKTNVE